VLERIRAELRRLRRTAGWSWAGVRAAWSHEKSFRQWACANLVSAALAFALDLSAAERALVLALGILVLVVELLNSAIEAVVDDVGLHRRPLAQRAKDYGSAAVAVTALAAGVAWAVILIS